MYSTSKWAVEPVQVPELVEFPRMLLWKRTVLLATVGLGLLSLRFEGGLRIYQGDLVKFDVAAEYRGYVGDTTLSAVVGGKPTPEQARLMSITYGGLLGTYLLGGLWPRARERDVIVAIIVSVVAMTPIVLGVPRRLLPGLAWPWYVPLGTAVTVAVGMLSSLVGRADSRTGGQDAQAP